MDQIIDVVYRAAFEELTCHFNGVLRTLETYGLTADAIATYFAIHRVHTIRMVPHIVAQILAFRNAPQTSWYVQPSGGPQPQQLQQQQPPYHKQQHPSEQQQQQSQTANLTKPESSDTLPDRSYNPGSPRYSPAIHDWSREFSPSITSTPRKKRRAQTPGPTISKRPRIE